VNFAKTYEITLPYILQSNLQIKFCKTLKKKKGEKKLDEVAD
jgi:hypothetical protein